MMMGINMKHVKIVFALLGALIVASASITLCACAKKNNAPRLDPDLSVIVDENTSNNILTEDVSSLLVSVYGVDEMGSASYAQESDAIVFSAAAMNSYRFAGWYTTADFSGQKVSSSAEYIASASELAKIMQNGSVVLYARFEKEYSITYDLRLGEFIGSSAPQTYVTSDEPQPLAENVTKKNCRFVGWRLSATGQTVTELPAGIEGDITLTAMWDDVTDSSNEFNNTVWMIDQNEFGVNAVFIFNTDGTLDIFSYNGDENRPYVNSGASLMMKYNFESLFENNEAISSHDILKIKYNCENAYYAYEVNAKGCEIIPTMQLPESEYCDIMNLLLGEVRYYLERGSDGNMKFMVYMPRRVSYRGVTYSMEDWQAFVLSNSITDASAVSYEYAPMDPGIILIKAADEVTDYTFSAFTANDTLESSYAFGYEYTIEGTNVTLERQNGKFGYFRVAFQRGEDVYTSFAYMDLFKLEIASVRYWNVSELDPIETPTVIELFKKKF